MIFLTLSLNFYFLCMDFVKFLLLTTKLHLQGSRDSLFGTRLVLQLSVSQILISRPEETSTSEGKH